MSTPGGKLPPRAMFAERFALLYAEARHPSLTRVAESVTRARRVDEQGRLVRVPNQRISDWRRGRNVPARFSALAAVLAVLIGLARANRRTPLVEGLYDLETWREWWQQALASPAGAERTTHGPAVDADRAGDNDELVGVCPYRGLAAFTREDADWFFGRERATAALLAKLSEAADSGGFVMLMGASGAGKSSLIRAGLAPAVERGALSGDGACAWPMVVMTPGADPIGALCGVVPELAEPLAAALDVVEPSGGEEERLPGSADAQAERPIGRRRRFSAAVHEALTAHTDPESAAGCRLVLVVDQFEEAFTLCADDQRRRLFIETLAAACMPATAGCAGAAVVLLGVRADFYARCLEHPELAQALQDQQMVLGPMTSQELREAVSGPAKAVGLQLETGLTELLLRDMGVNDRQYRANWRGGAHMAGALPLLSHALLATWQRRESAKLTIGGYRAAGGISGAVAATAERAWAGLDAAGRKAARAILLRLVRVGPDQQDTRRKATRQELVDQAAEPAAASEALEALASARLITLDADTVEITHEALLHAWPRLRKWVDEDRSNILLRQRLDDDAASWVEQGRESSLLYRGARLGTAEQWATAAGPSAMTYVAREFLAMSIRQRRRSGWARRAAVAAVVVFAMIAAVTAVVAVRQRDDAVFRQVVAEADRLRDSDPSLSAQLDLVAHRLRPDDKGVYARLISTQNTPLATPLLGHSGAVYQTSFSPDGRTLATASYDRTARLWDVTDRAHPKPLAPPLTGHTSWVTSAVFSPDGRTLATAGDDHTVRLWNVADPAHPTPIGEPLAGDDGTIYLTAFSPDGHTLATANEDRTVRLWDVRDPANVAPLGHPLTGHTAPVRSVAFSAGGNLLAAGGDDGTVLLWNVADPAHPASVGPPLAGHTGTVHTVAFSPNGRTLASGSEDKFIQLWNVADPERLKPLGPPLAGHTAPVWSVEFSPDGLLLASASADSTIRMWNVTDLSHAAQLGQPLAGSNGTAFTAAFSPDGHTLASGSADSTLLWSVPTQVLNAANVAITIFSPDGRVLVTASDKTIRLWDTTDPGRPRPFGHPLTGHTGPIYSAALSPDGHTLATGSGDGTTRIWNIADRANPTAIGQPILLHIRYSGRVAFSPDGRTLVTGADDQTVQLWDINDPVHPAAIGRPLVGHTGSVNAVAFSPDGHTLATASSDQSTRLWNVADPTNPAPIGQPLTGHTAVNAVTFSPDGHTLATASNDKTVRLWDLRDPSHPFPLGSPLIGHTEPVVSLAFSPGGHTLASGSDDKTVRLWTLANAPGNAPVSQPVTGHAASVQSVTFSSDGHFFATASADNKAMLWDTVEAHAVQRICAATQRVLSPQQWQQHLPQLPYRPPCG